MREAVSATDVALRSVQTTLRAPHSTNFCASARALAQKFVECGARKVVCTDLNATSVAETASLIGEAATGEVLDVSDQAAIDQLVSRLEEEGGIDIFVSNAGYGKRGGLNLSVEDWKKMMDVHT